MDLPLPSSSDKSLSSASISKWATLQMLLKDEVSLETSVNLRHKQTISQFSSKCYKIYKKKIKVKDLTDYNRRIIEKISTSYSYSPTKINILGIEQHLSKGDEICYFLTEFRKNNHLMLELIDSLNHEEHKIIVPFLCHFFYENFYSESTEQIEMLYIIYLLLEKEIDKLHTSSINSFLDDSFIGKFLIEFANRYEVKCYLNRILKELIIAVENDYNEYIELDIDEWRLNDQIKKKKLNRIKKSKSIPGLSPLVNKSFVRTCSKKNIMNNSLLESNKEEEGLANITMTNSSFLNNCDKDIRISIANTQKNEEEINKVFNESEMKFRLERVEGYEKVFLLYHMKKIGHDKGDLFSNANIMNSISQLPSKTKNRYIEDSQKAFDLISKFITTLFANINNDISIMPYSIKCICKMIKVLIGNKFKGTNTNSFISQFLFKKLIIPILQNPDINDFGSSTVISIPTRQNLLNISKVLQQFNNGNLFTSQSESHFTIFNSFIFNHIASFDLILNSITSSITLPLKLDKLSKEFHAVTGDSSSFILDNSKRQINEINYDYFNENQYDFMEHQSICFEYKQFNILFKKVKENLLLENHPEMKKVYRQITEHWPTITSQMCPNLERNFYVIIKDSYKEDVKKLLFTKEKPILLGATTIDNSDYTKEMKYCVGYLLSQIEMQNNCDWVAEKPNTIDTFNLIHDYNEYHDEINNNEKVPLSWYSSYAITNLCNMPMKYKENDYELLYDEIFQETKRKIDLLKKINDFLTIQITSKFFCLDHNIHIARKELQMIRGTKLNIEIEKFIETITLSMCIITVGNFKELVVNHCSECCHSQVNENNNSKRKEKEREKEKDKVLSNDLMLYHCSNIREFIDLFSHFSSIQNDLINNTSHSKANEALNVYLNHIKIIMTPQSSTTNTSLFKDTKEFIFKSCKLPKSNNNKPDILIEDIVLNEISNYILKKSYSSIYPLNPIMEDIDFYHLCRKIQWIDPIKNMTIPPAVHNTLLFDKLKEYVYKLEMEKTPSDKLKALIKEVGLITSLIKFTTDEKIVPAESLMPIIVYSIIIAKPKRMISSYRWIKMFMNENMTLGDLGYIVTNIEMGINFVTNVDHNMLKVTEEEFRQKCSKCLKEQPL